MTSTRAFTIQAATGRRRREATQRQILDAAHRLLAGGSAVAALSVDRIVAEAGVSRSTFYLHFPDKRELIARLAERELADLPGVLAPILAQPLGGRDIVEQVVHGMVDNWRRHAPAVSGLIELSEYDEAARDAWRASVDAIASVVARALRQRWAQRPPEESDPDTVAHIIAWMFERVGRQMLREPENDVRVARALTDVVWRIVGPAP